MWNKAKKYTKQNQTTNREKWPSTKNLTEEILVEISLKIKRIKYLNGKAKEHLVTKTIS